MPEFYVSRQRYYYADPIDRNIVEIAVGGIDMSGADMLVCRYDGEAKTYFDPREAAKAAIAIMGAWQKDEPTLKINIGAGCTGGMGLEMEPETPEQILAWAEKVWEKTPKCARCGKACGEREAVMLIDGDPDEKFCGDYCAERTWEDNEREQAKFEREERRRLHPKRFRFRWDSWRPAKPLLA